MTNWYRNPSQRSAGAMSKVPAYANRAKLKLAQLTRLMRRLRLRRTKTRVCKNWHCGNRTTGWHELKISTDSKSPRYSYVSRRRDANACGLPRSKATPLRGPSQYSVTSSARKYPRAGHYQLGGEIARHLGIDPSIRPIPAVIYKYHICHFISLLHCALPREVCRRCCRCAQVSKPAGCSFTGSPRHRRQF